MIPGSIRICVSNFFAKNGGVHTDTHGLERWLALAIGRCGTGSNPTAENFASELWQFRLPRFASECLSEETLKAVGPFYLVSMPGEVKDPTNPHWNV